MEGGAHGAAAGLEEVDGAGAVPHVVIAAQRMHQAEHPERIGHREQAAAEMGADVVAVPGAHPQLHLDLPVVRGDAGDMDAGEQERRPQVDAEAERAGFHVRTGRGGENPSLTIRMRMLNPGSRS